MDPVNNTTIFPSFSASTVLLCSQRDLILLWVVLFMAELCFDRFLPKHFLAVPVLTLLVRANSSSLGSHAEYI